jgi:Fe-S-cluster-containing dehydrogenase component
MCAVRSVSYGKMFYVYSNDDYFKYAKKELSFQTACSNACSNGAMTFGMLTIKEVEIKKLADDERMYHLLEHVGTKPNVLSR